jgi:glycosyltransferase involved in cell wall biosynthesis
MLPAEPVEPSASGQIRLLFVGRLEERKGIDVLLRALKEIMPRYPQLSVDIVGNDKLPGADGKAYRDAFESDAEMQSARARIRFHGEVSEKHLRGFYRACDIFVAPSRFESFGLILLEAMMFGKPVIGCRTGGMPEIVEDGVSGLLAEPGDVDSLERCITRLIEDPDLRDQLGVRARRRYEDEFTSTHMAVQIVDFLTAVAGADRLELAAGS